MENFQYIDPLNLSGTVKLFKELGQPEQAMEMIRHYVQNRKEDARFFDLRQYPFQGDISDPDVRAAFEEKFKAYKVDIGLKEALLSLRSRRDDHVLAFLAATAVDDYYTLFKESSGPELRLMISECLEFRRFPADYDNVREIAAKAEAALIRIASDSPINARRVKNLGIKLEEE